MRHSIEVVALAANKLRNWWSILVVAGGVVTGIAWANSKVKVIESVPLAIDSLRMQHTAQTEILKDQREYARQTVCLLEYPRGADRDYCLTRQGTAP